jgi:hypothetical protein
MPTQALGERIGQKVHYYLLPMVYKRKLKHNGVDPIKKTWSKITHSIL